MHTYAPAFYAWVPAKHGIKVGRAAGIAGAVGAALPDVPSFAGTAFYWIRAVGTRDEEGPQAVHFSGPLGATGSARSTRSSQ